MIKPSIERRQVQAVLSRHFGAAVEDIAPVDTGQIARVFSFDVGGKGFIVRFVKPVTAESIEKDRFVAKRLASSEVPVPPIIQQGVSGDLHYAIASLVPGVPLRGWHGEDDWPVVTQLIETLDAIHRTDISDTIGYGMFDGDGRGTFPTWPEALLDVAAEGEPGSFYGAWHHYFNDTFLDRQFFDRIYGHMTALLEFCPAERSLVHGDYAYGNVMVQNEKITAVLDWANAMYGDFLYDVAWMDLGSPALDYRSRFRRYYQETDRPVDHFEERLLCYQCYISLDAQRWYAKSSNSADYAWMRDRTLHLLGRGSDGV
ncbi:MAG: aminoglycoside phosphotransferase family protein [Chloroflexi bacterium]|nr:aminoglycoside phosphotransferase family protein [Chloroflexota bacterium]